MKVNLFIYEFDSVCFHTNCIYLQNSISFIVPEMQQSSPLDETTEGDDVSMTSDTSRRLSKFTSFFKGNSRDNLIDYDRSEFRRYWMPDSTVKECYECHEKFTPFRRKHHCRLCGQIFCAKCSSHSINGAALGNFIFSNSETVNCFSRICWCVEGLRIL